MKRLILLLLLLPFNAIAQPKVEIPNDTLYTFIGELMLNMKKVHANAELSYTPYDHFNRKYRLLVFLAHGDKKGPELPDVEVREKERYYNDPSEKKRVEVRIKVPIRYVNPDNPVLPVAAVLYSKRTNSSIGSTAIFDLRVPDRGMDEYINNRTFKFFTRMPLGSPEMVGLDVTTSYLKSIIDSNTAYGFDKTLLALNRFQDLTPNRYVLDETQLKDFYRLLNFIEPYLDENSFWKTEAKKLKQLIDLEEIKRADKVDPDPRSEKRIDSSAFEYTTATVSEMKAVYEDYRELITRLQLYYSQLELILFLKTPTQVQHIASREKPAGGFILKAGVGPSILYMPSRVYEVTISSNDSFARFQKIRPVHTALSAGVLLTIGARKPPISGQSNRNYDSTQRLKDGMMLGVFINYYLSPAHTGPFSASALGGSLALGYSFGRLNVLAVCGMRKARVPRDYFVAQYSNQNNPISSAGPVSFDNNNYFIDKWNLCVGISLVYGISKRYN